MATSETTDSCVAATTTTTGVGGNNNIRLDFDHLHHCGRKKELAKLQQLYQESCCCCCQGRAGACIVEASSGRGKTALLEAFKKLLLVQQDDDTLVCSGKFEERTAASEPFSAVGEATTELFQHLARSEEERDVWRQRIGDALGAEIIFLKAIFPGINVLFPVREEEQLKQTLHDDGSSESVGIDFDTFGNMADKEWRFERFRLAFRSLFRCVSTHCPIVLLLDDLHWIDLDSLSVLKTLLNDTHEEGRKFLFVGASRMVETYHCLHELRNGQFDIYFIQLPRLSVNDLSDLLVDLLHREPRDLAVLANIIHEKTGGNSFVVLQLLRILEQNQLIFYSSGTTENQEPRWDWNSERIMSECNISGNITEVVADHLKLLDDRQKRALAIAAIFRVSRFDVKTIVHAMSFLGDQEGISMSREIERQEDTDPWVVAKNVRELNEQLLLAAKEGLVKEVSPGHYKFAHDRIREAAYSLLPEGHEKKLLHLNIGRQLRSWMDMAVELGISLSEESLLLHATKQLNLGSSLITDSWERLDLAELNFQAAQLAAKKSSFFPAIDYLHQGLHQLRENPWENHYVLMYKLSVALVRIEYCCGLSADCIKTADDILAHTQDFREKCPVYHTKILCLLQQEKQREAQQLNLAILDELGQPLPKRLLMVHVVRVYLKVQRMLKGLSDEDILNIPEVDDEQLNMCAEFLERLLEHSFLGGDPEYFFLAQLRIGQLMFERGRFPLTVSFLNGWAYTKVVFGDLCTAFRFGNLTLQLADGRGQQHDSRMKVIFYSFVHHWRLPVRDGIAPFQAAIAELWDYGALDFVSQDAQVFYRLLFVCGEPLNLVLSRAEKFTEYLSDYKQEIQWNFMLPLLQAASNLQGDSKKDPSILSGKYMDEEERLLAWKKSGNKQAIFQHQFFVMMLAYHFSHYELAEKTVQQMQPLFEDGPGPLVQPRVLYTGLVFWARFRATRRGKYRRKANAALRQLQKWADGGAVSCVPFHLLLNAESLSTRRHVSKAEVMNVYDKAIEALRNSGLCHCKALANELAGAYLMQNQEDSSRASVYLTRALTLYEEWGADAKVEHMRGHYRDILAEGRGSSGTNDV